MTNVTAPLADGYVPHAAAIPSAEVRRSASLVYVVEDDAVRTELLLFNYWRHKRRIDGLRLRLCVYSATGERVAAVDRPIDFPAATAVAMRELLASAGVALPFEGSAEIEILSPVNLVIQYPAVIVRYTGDGWHSTTHSYTRTLSADSGDAVPDRVARLREGAFTIPADDSGEPFVVVHNGEPAVAAHELTFEVCNAAGEVRRFALPRVAYAPRETRRLFPARLFPIREHLGGAPGCLVVETRVAGTFPRLLTGVRRADGALTTDHSFVTCESDRIGDDLVAPPALHDRAQPPLSRAVPVLDGYTLWLDVYPHHPRADYRLAIRVLDAAGVELDRVERRLAAAGSRMESIAIEPGRAAVAVVDIDGDGAVPRRFGFGVRYQRGSTLCGFIAESGIPRDSEGASFQWLPTRLGAGARGHLVLHNHRAGPAPADAEYELSLYGSDDRPPLVVTRRVPVGHTVRAPVDELFEGAADYLAGDWGWIISRTPQRTRGALYYAIAAADGSLAVDHAF